MRLSALQAALAAHGQRLSLDPPGDPTLAECLLDDLSGPLRHRFGTMRDLVIGVTVVLAGRHARELRRQGREERRRLRPRQALLRLARTARHASSGSRCGCTRCRRRRARVVDRRRALARAAPLAARAERGRHRRRPDARPLRGRAARGRRAGARARRRGGASRGTSCARCRRRCPAACAGTAAPAPLVRPGPARRVRRRSAAEPAWSPLAERVVEAMCSPS